MGTYVTPEQVREYGQDLDEVSLNSLDDAFLQRVILRASLDIDSALAPYEPVEASPALKLDPEALTPRDAEALARATAAQVCHRVLLGESHFSAPEPEVLRSFTAGSYSESYDTPGAPPLVADRALHELAGSGLHQRSGTVPTKWWEAEEAS